MPVFKNDLTLSEALRDPLILAVAKADGVSAEELGRLLIKAAAMMEGQPRRRARENRARRPAADRAAPAPVAVMRPRAAAPHCCGML